MTEDDADMLAPHMPVYHVVAETWNDPRSSGQPEQLDLGWYADVSWANHRAWTWAKRAFPCFTPAYDAEGHCQWQQTRDGRGCDTITAEDLLGVGFEARVIAR